MLWERNNPAAIMGNCAKRITSEVKKPTRPKKTAKKIKQTFEIEEKTPAKD